MLVALYVLLVSWAQGLDHALELMWDDRLFVGLISTGFGTQVGLFSYMLLLRGDLAAQSVALTGAGTTTSSVAMLACCAHHLTDVLPIIGLSGLAVFLVDFRALLMVVGLATNAIGIAVMVRQLRRITAGVHVVSRRGLAVAS